MFDSGTSTGEIAGHTKVINAVSIRHQRPFRAATASDDCTIVFHTGEDYAKSGLEIVSLNGSKNS